MNYRALFDAINSHDSSMSVFVYRNKEKQTVFKVLPTNTDFTAPDSLQYLCNNEPNNGLFVDHVGTLMRSVQCL